MSDDLVKHLRGGLVMVSVGLRAADRIEELETALAAVGSAAAYRITQLEAENAKLAKAVEVLGSAVGWVEKYQWAAPWTDDACAILAQIGGDA